MRVGNGQLGSCLTDATREAAPGVPFVNSPLRQSPNACASDRRGISDPVVPYKPPRLISQIYRGPLALSSDGLSL